MARSNKPRETRKARAQRLARNARRREQRAEEKRTAKALAKRQKKQRAAKKTRASKLKTLRAKLPATKKLEIAKAQRAFEALRAPKYKKNRKGKKVPRNEARADTFEKKKKALVAALKRARIPESAIRATLAQITRRRNVARTRLAEDRLLATRRAFDATKRNKDEDARLADLSILKKMLREEDKRWLKFLATAKDEGLGFDEAVDEWFSPKALG